MKYFKNVSCLFMVLWLFVSCQKEVSVELGGSNSGGNKNCRIQKLIEADATSSHAEYAYISTYDGSNKVSNIQLVDSTVNSIDFTFPISYQAAKIQVDANQFFVLGSDGKVTEFHGFEVPDDPTSEKVTVKYTYNGSGQMVLRTEEFDSLPGVVLIKTDYSYTGSNLTKAIVSANAGRSFVSIGEVTYEYDVSKTVKSFLFLHALAAELFYFQTVVNAGTNSVNPITKATIKAVDFTTGNINTSVSNFVNYSIDANNYVKNFEMTGADFYVAGLYSGKKYILNYSCL